MPSAMEVPQCNVEKEGVQERAAHQLQEKTTAMEVTQCNHVEKAGLQEQAAVQPQENWLEKTAAATDKTGEAPDKERHESDDKEDEDIKVEAANMEALKKIMDEVAAAIDSGELVPEVLEDETPEEEVATEDVGNNEEEVTAEKDAPGKENKKEGRKESSIRSSTQIVHRIETAPGISQDEMLQTVLKVQRKYEHLDQGLIQINNTAMFGRGIYRFDRANSKEEIVPGPSNYLN